MLRSVDYIHIIHKVPKYFLTATIISTMRAAKRPLLDPPSLHSARACRANKEELQDANRQPRLFVDDLCPICARCGVSCFIASHPSFAPAPPPGASANNMYVNTVIETHSFMSL